MKITSKNILGFLLILLLLMNIFFIFGDKEYFSIVISYVMNGRPSGGVGVPNSVAPAQPVLDFPVYERTGSRVSTPCPKDRPLVVLAIGQSNAANNISEVTGKDASKFVYNFFRGACYELEDPVLGASGERGSLWTLFSHQMKTNRPVVIIAAAVGGTRVSQWATEGSQLFANVKEQVGLAAGQDLLVDLIIWHQGEDDGRRGTLRASYEASLLTLIRRLERETQVSPGTPWLIHEATVCNSAPNFDIQAAQRNVGKMLTYVHVASNTDLLGPAYRYDGCHFNAAGRQKIIHDLLVKMEQLGLVAE